MQQRKVFNYLFFWKKQSSKASLIYIERLSYFWIYLQWTERGLLVLPFRGLKLPDPPPRITTHSFKKKGPACLGEQSGLLRSIHAPIMCRLTKAEAASKSLMQNLCSCGCFSGWKNQYCGSDARRWLSALWLTVKAKRDWGATFTVLEMERSGVCLIVEFTFNFNFIVAYFGSSEDFKTLYH